MAGGDVDAGGAAQFPHGVGEGGGGHQFPVEVGLDAVGGKDPGGLPGEQFRVDTAVIGHGGGRGVEPGQKDIGVGLGGPADGVDVHPVGAGPQHPPQPGGAELQVGVKAVVHLLVLALDGLQLPGQGGVLQLLGEPAAVFLVDLHDVLLLSSKAGTAFFFKLYCRTPQQISQ